MSHQLVGLLGGGIQGHRVVHLVIRAVRHLLVAAVYGRGRSIHQMLHRVVAAGLQNVVEADHIAFDISIWVGDGVSHTRLCAEVDHDVGVILFKNAVNEILVCEITLNKGVVLELLKLRQASFLDTNVVIIVHVIQTDDLGIRLGSQDTLGKVGADKTGRTSYKYCFSHFYHPYPFLHTILLTTFTYP